MIAVLFARTDSIYKTIPGLDVYDIERDARNYSGEFPVVAHPPCRAWGKLRKLAKPRPDEKELAFFAVQKIRQNGGVLEHPAYSTLWAAAGLPRPGAGFDEYGGFSLDINQTWFGHKAQKRTWLYICGISPMDVPPISLSFDAITHTVCQDPRKIKKELSKKAREATPLKLAQWMVSVCETILQSKTTKQHYYEKH